MKNVIAYSIWGEHPMYWVGAVRNIEAAQKYFPGWVCRFYVDNTSRPDFIEMLKGDNVEIVMIDPTEAFAGMFWRFWAASDSDVDIMLSRDCDSRLGEREIAAVTEWLNSDKDFHIMRDHPYHTVPILGGMWGVRNGLLRPNNIDIVSMISQWTHYSIKGCDQDFLGQVIYPLVKNNSMEHSEFNLQYGGTIRPFPTTRIDYEFIGDVFDENDIRHPDYWQLIKRFYGH
jgi:hypothetical protein